MKGRLKKVVAVFLSFNLLVPFISNAYAASYSGICAKSLE